MLLNSDAITEKDSYAILISNEEKYFIIFEQQSENEHDVVFWDYHVIALERNGLKSKIWIDRNCHFGGFAVLHRNSVYPRTTTIFQPEQLSQSKIFGNADTAKYNFILFLPSSPDSRQYDNAQRYNSPTKPYKLRFRGVILFRINFVFEYYTETNSSLGGERAQTVTGCSRSC